MRNRIIAKVRSLRASRHGTKTTKHLVALKKHAQRTIDHLDVLYDVNNDRIADLYTASQRLQGEQNAIIRDQMMGQQLLGTLADFDILA